MRLPENTSAKIALRHASEPHLDHNDDDLIDFWDEASRKRQNFMEKLVSDKTKVTLCKFFTNT